MDEKTIKELENKLETAKNEIIKSAKLRNKYFKDMSEISDCIFDDNKNADKTGSKRIKDLLKKFNDLDNCSIESLL